MDKDKLNKKKAGRIQYTIDWAFVDEHLEGGCTGSQVAAMLGMHPDTFYERTVKEKGVSNFSAYLQQKKAKGDANIHMWQYRSAKRGNIQMLIWLGKQRLGQKDKQPEEVAQTQVNIEINRIPT